MDIEWAKDGLKKSNDMIDKGFIIAGSPDSVAEQMERVARTLKVGHVVCLLHFGDMPNEHDMLTGSDSDGRAFPPGFDTTCNNWTSDGAANKAMLGHADRTGGGNVSWNSVHMSAGCSKDTLIRTGGAGHLYCFATN